MKKSKKKQTIQVREPGGINLKQLFYSIYKNRYWFLLSAATGLMAAVLYDLYVPPKYDITTTILVKTDNSQATLTSVRPDIPDDNKGVTVLDQVGVLSSYNLNLQTLQNLKWDVSWAAKGLINNTDLYKDAPLKLDTVQNAFQVKGIPLEILPENDQKYTIRCNAVQEANGRKHKIRFESTGFYGKPFKNTYFNFTLSKIPGRLIDNSDDFLLTFNDLTQLAKFYQQELKVTPGDDGSDLITIELASRQPERAIDYLSKLDGVYIKFGLAEKNKRAANTVKFINAQIAGISDSLQETGNSVSDYRSTNNVIDINQQSTSIVNDLDKIQNEVSASRMQLEYYNNLKRYINNSGALKSMVAPSVIGITDATLNTLVAKLSDLFHQREVLSYTATDNSPQMVSLDEEITYTQKSLSENLNNLISNTQVQLASLSRQEANINAEKTTIPKTEQNLNKIKRKFDFNNDLYTYLLQKRSEAQIAEASRDPDAQIIDGASFGTATLKGFNSIINLLVGIILGLIVPLFYLTGQSFFKNRLKYVTDIREKLRPSIIGNILYNKFDNELPVIMYPHADITESFRNLRINIQYLLKERENKVISVHSSIVGEGKTFVSSNLAAILAINNKSVLLVDADLRQPRTHEIFHCSNKKGLSDYLNGTLTFNEVVNPTVITGLSLVTSGPKPVYPSELLGSDRLGSFIKEAKEHYEYIIFNNSPLGIVKDGMMIEPFSDINLFLLRMKKSSVNQIDYINQLIQEGTINNVVVSLNNITPESYGIIDRQEHGYYNDNRILKLN